MPIVKASSGKSNVEPVAAGVHQGVCVAIVDIGTQVPTNPQHKTARKVWISWELPHETVKVNGEDKPRMLSEKYTMSLHEKGRLLPMLKSWRGSAFTPEELKAFDMAKLIGRNCQLNVVHNKGKNDPTKVYANITAVIPLPKGMPPVPPSGKTLVYDIPEAGPIVIPDDIPEWLANKIKESVEYKERMGSIPPVPEAANDGAPY